VAQTGIPRLLETLAEDLAPSDLQSLMLEVYRKRAGGIRAAEIIARSGPLMAASNVDARVLNRFDRMAFDAAEEFEAVDLSPVCAFGTEAALGRVDQNNLLTTIRNAEVLGDATPVLALECARRRKVPASRATGTVRLCNSHRVVRMQPFDFPGFTPHFRLFSLVSAGRDTGSRAFEIRHLEEHIRFYLRLFRALNGDGFQAAAPLVEVSDLSITEELLTEAGVTRAEIRDSIRAHRLGKSEQFLLERGVRLPADLEHPRLEQIRAAVFEPVHAEYPEAELRFNLARLEGLGYYPGLCLRISPMAPDGARYPVVDGGFTDWTARLLEDRKERLLTSCIGVEFTCRKFRV
jgi:hypothetical protein